MTKADISHILSRLQAPYLSIKIYNMKTIVAATDYSATASNAVQFAANLARVFKANLVLFNVYHLSVHVSNSLVTPAEIDHLFGNNEIRLMALAKETARQYEINVSGVSKSGDTVGALMDYATTHQPDLIVVGMDSNLAEYKLFGNTTTTAIRHLETPVLVIPNDVPFKGIGKILYACEYSCLSEDNHLDLLKEITRKFEAALQIFHVETKKQIPVAVDDQISAIDSIMEDVDHTYNFVENASIIDGITHEAEAWQADLLVMVPHKAGFWELLSKGSATRKMTLITRIPLLLLPNMN